MAVAAGNLWFVCSIGCNINVANRTNHKFPTATPTGVPSEVKSTVQLSFRPKALTFKLVKQVARHWITSLLYKAVARGVLWVLKNPPPPPPPQTKKGPPKGPLECTKRSTITICLRGHHRSRYNSQYRGSEQVAIQSAGACMHVLKSYTGRSTFFTQRTYPPNCLATALLY